MLSLSPPQQGLRMSDKEVQKAKRLWEHTGSHGDEAIYLGAKLKAGEIEESTLRITAMLGHRAAQIVTSQEFLGWEQALTTLQNTELDLKAVAILLTRWFNKFELSEEFKELSQTQILLTLFRDEIVNDQLLPISQTLSYAESAIRLFELADVPPALLDLFMHLSTFLDGQRVCFPKVLSNSIELAIRDGHDERASIDTAIQSALMREQFQQGRVLAQLNKLIHE